VVVLPETPAAGALVIAERLRKAIRRAWVPTGPGSPRACPHRSALFYPDHALTPEGLIQKADQAMYRVKERDKTA